MRHGAPKTVRIGVGGPQRVETGFEVDVFVVRVPALLLRVTEEGNRKRAAISSFIRLSIMKIESLSLYICGLVTE